MSSAGEPQDGEKPRGAGCFLTGGTILFGVFTMGAIAAIPKVSPARNSGAFYGGLGGAILVGLIFLGFLVAFIAARPKREKVDWFPPGADLDEWDEDEDGDAEGDDSQRQRR